MDLDAIVAQVDQGEHELDYQASSFPTTHPLLGRIDVFLEPRVAALCSHCLVVQIQNRSGLHFPIDWEVLLGSKEE